MIHEFEKVNKKCKISQTDIELKSKRKTEYALTCNRWQSALEKSKNDLNFETEIREHKIKLKSEIMTCDVKAGEEQNPLSLDSPGLRRMAGLY
jgi:hypothetical protein